jgi:hypothetical protein
VSSNNLQYQNVSYFGHWLLASSDLLLLNIKRIALASRQLPEASSPFLTN